MPTELSLLISSGNIDFSEFYHRLSPPLTGKRLQVVKEVFKDLDKNRNGVLEYEDIRGDFIPPPYFVQ